MEAERDVYSSLDKYSAPAHFCIWILAGIRRHGSVIWLEILLLLSFTLGAVLWSAQGMASMFYLAADDGSKESCS